jgi:hypothetical protein
MGLLMRAGVSPEEIEANRTEEKVIHACLKGVDFDITAKAVFREHGVRIVE